ncbi:GspE/PulE family protein [Patescibacteria group bacterium]
MSLSLKKYQEIFVDSGLLKEEEFVQALKESESSGQQIESVLVNFGFVSDNQIGHLMADAYGVKFVNLRRQKIDPKYINVVPEAMRKRQGAIVYGQIKDKVQVAMVDPQNFELIGFIQKKVQRPLEIGYMTPELASSVAMDQDEDITTKINTYVTQFEEMRKSGEIAPGAQVGNEDFIIELVDLLTKYGHHQGASDVHIEPKEKTSTVRYRIDGILHDLFTFPQALHEFVVARIKILSNLRTDEHYSAQDSKFRLRVGGEPVNIRVSIVPIAHGEKVVMRILSEHGGRLTMESLGLNPEDLAKLESAASKPYGMILSTGPTGSGKTTSLYAILKKLNTREVNIQTIEDPVEYGVEGVNQIQVNEKTGLTFANGLRAIVRQDPDIILVGEIRDTETASISINSAMTGHLVLSTLHTNDAATAIPRLIDMEIERFLIASTVNLIIAQRLVRKICPECVSSNQINLVQYKDSIPPAIYKKFFGAKKKERLYFGKGCQSCNFLGFSGRLGIFEIMEITTRIREMIMKQANAEEIMTEAVKEGMTTMLEDGLRKVKSGQTNIEEVLRVVK